MKKYYIGLDAHSRTCSFVVMDVKGHVLIRKRVDTTEAEILGLIRSIEGYKELAFEESTLSQWLYVLLKNEVDELVVANPALITKSSAAKTDFLDATELADVLRVKRLKPVFHSADERMELRALISGYEDLIQEIVRTKNRITALFRQCAITVGGTAFYSHPEAVEKLPSKTKQEVARALFEQLSLLVRQRREIYGERFRKNLRRFKELRLLCSIPAFGVVRSNQVVGIVVTPHRFADKYHFFSYAMLIRHKQLSDGTQYGNKRAFGKVQLKAIFKSAAVSALRGDNAFRRKYDRMRRAGVADKAARNAVSRALAATMLGVWKSGRKYNDHYQEVQQREGCRRQK
jgi:transposase